MGFPRRRTSAPVQALRRLTRKLQVRCTQSAPSHYVGGVAWSPAEIPSVPLSNQAQRTYAPKPRYAVKFWQKHNLIPEPVDVLEIVRERAERYYSDEATASGKIVHGDSRKKVFARAAGGQKADWIITSPHTTGSVPTCRTSG